MLEEDVGYRLESNENTNGTVLVPAQHKRFLQDNNDDRNPREAFREDLATELAEWINSGDQILIGGDVNTEVTHSSIQDIFAEHHMTNAIYELHDATDAPPTYFRTRSNRVVDGIWKTPGIEIVAGGFLALGEFTGDHSLLWLDVTYRSALGHNPPMPVTPAARRLQLHNSKLVERYLCEYEKLISQENLCERQFSLEATTSMASHSLPPKPKKRRQLT